MAKIVNLSRARKSRVRDDKRSKADEAAARHGRTKAEKQRNETEARKLSDHLDQHRRDE